MEKQVIFCDHCSKEGGIPFSYEVDNERDAAGDTDTITERVDLCPLCCAKQLELFILALPWTARKKFTEDLLKSKKFYLGHMSRTQRVYGLAGEWS